MCCFWSIHTKTYHDRLASRLSIFSTDTLGSFFSLLSVCAHTLGRITTRISWSRSNMLATHMLHYYMCGIYGCFAIESKWRKKGEDFCLLFACRMRFFHSVCSFFMFFFHRVFVSYRPNQRDRRFGWLCTWRSDGNDFTSFQYFFFHSANDGEKQTFDKKRQQFLQCFEGNSSRSFCLLAVLHFLHLYWHCQRKSMAHNGIRFPFHSAINWLFDKW